MTDDIDDTPNGFILITDVLELSHIPRSTFDDRLVALGIQTYSLPRDRRRGMIRVEDLALITAPQPKGRRRKTTSPRASRYLA